MFTYTITYDSVSQLSHIESHQNMVSSTPWLDEQFFFVGSLFSFYCEHFTFFSLGLNGFWLHREQFLYHFANDNRQNDQTTINVMRILWNKIVSRIYEPFARLNDEGYNL